MRIFEYLTLLLCVTQVMAQDRPNIILIVTDDQRWDALGCAGNPVIQTPNMDRLAGEAALGQTVPIRPGITPGSGPAHLALFGYDPLVYDIGRGALAAVGSGMRVNPGDVAARGNFCTLDDDGNISHNNVASYASV